MALTTEQRLDRLEEAIKELYTVLEEAWSPPWPEDDSKVKEIVEELNP